MIVQLGTYPASKSASLLFPPCPRLCQLITLSPPPAGQPPDHLGSRPQVWLFQPVGHLRAPRLPPLSTVCVCVRVCVCACVCVCVRSCPTLCNSMHCSPPGSSVHGSFPAIIVKLVARPSSRGSSQTRDQTHISCIIGRFFTAGLPGKPYLLFRSKVLDWSKFSFRFFRKML